MRTMMRTRQRLGAGAGALVIYESARAWYVVHQDADGHVTSLCEAQYSDYGAAYARLEQERQAREKGETP